MTLFVTLAAGSVFPTGKILSLACKLLLTFLHLRSAAIVNSGQRGLSQEKGSQNPEARPIGRRTGHATDFQVVSFCWTTSSSLSLVLHITCQPTPPRGRRGQLRISSTFDATSHLIRATMVDF
jgi:hypothetical protein